MTTGIAVDGYGLPQTAATARYRVSDLSNADSGTATVPLWPSMSRTVFESPSM
ncbi:hypothetical protein G3A43_40575 [Paraburkholderia aspalathi]|uniref:hypothetical protein n=1 Tax=Paraburkholderia nemoris TaxID=2793076 RepID=UPI00190AE83D|nr:MULTISPECIES: hypothetical protein [Paraburkholderia]MBK3786498.1 hypothetical protein [Paraburkholderia aspalathi]